jgi:translation elongation factor EF-G
LTDSSEPFQLRFAERAAALIEIPSIRCDATASGLTISGAAERDLERAVLAVREAFPSAAPDRFEVVYLNDPEWREPYVRVRVTTPEDYYGDVIADLHRRRGTLETLEEAADRKSVTATVPLAELIGYDTALRAMTRNRGTFDYQLVDYRPLQQPPPPRPRPAARA